MFCLRLPETLSDLGGCFLMNTQGTEPIHYDSLDVITKMYEDFWGFEIIEIDSLENRNIIKSYGIIQKPTDIEEN